MRWCGMTGIDIDKLLADEEMRKKLNEWTRKRAEEWSKHLKCISENYRNYLKKIARGEIKLW